MHTAHPPQWPKGFLESLLGHRQPLRHHHQDTCSASHVAGPQGDNSASLLLPRFPSPISCLSQLVTWLPGIQRKSKPQNKNLLDFLMTNIQTPGTHKALPFLLLKMETVPSCCLGIQPALTSPAYPLPGSVRGGGDIFNLSTCLYSSLSPCPISSALNHIQVYHPTTNLNLTSPPSYYPLTFLLSLHCPTS